MKSLDFEEFAIPVKEEFAIPVKEMNDKVNEMATSGTNKDSGTPSVSEYAGMRKEISLNSKLTLKRNYLIAILILSLLSAIGIAPSILAFIILFLSILALGNHTL